MLTESPHKAIFKPVFDRILKIYSGPDNKQYKAFYDEIVSRCVADVAGILQSGDKDLNARPGADLRTMYVKLQKQYGEDSARDLIMGNLPGFVKGQVHTPHPTEVFNDNAIQAEERLVAALIKVPELFQLKNGVRNAFYTLPEETTRNLSGALHQLSSAIENPLSKPLTIDEEMRRSIRFSQRQFDSVPAIADTVMHAMSVDSAALGYDQLKQFSHLIEPGTWSPGDQDSKPDMTAEMLAKGAALNRRAMMFHYYRTLAVIGSNASANAEVSDDTREKMERILYRLLKTGASAYETPKPVTLQLAKDKLLGVSETGITDQFSRRFETYAETSFFADFKKHFSKFEDQNLKPYSSTNELLSELKDLRDLPGVIDIKDIKRNRITALDAMIIQTMNFKDSALRIQIRQNGELHSEVLDNLMAMLPEGINSLSEVQRKALHSETDSSAIEMLIDRFHTDKNFAEQVKQTVSNAVEQIGTKNPTTKNLNEGAVTKDEFGIYQTLRSMELAAQNPDRIPRYLIAECRSKTQMLEAFFLLEVAESIAAPDVKGKVEIVNLVEHPDRAMEMNGGIAAAQMSSRAFDNPYFREHHLAIVSANHLLDDFSLAKGTQHLNVAQVKRTYGYEVHKGDETRTIEGVKMMMGAGSDITKAGSSAAAAVMMDAMDKTREAFLNQEHPVLLQDYIGCGGGIHRTQPVSTSYETVQGRSMRQSAENIAQKSLGLLTNHLQQRLAMNPSVEGQLFLAKDRMSKDQRALMARVNMGNMAGLPQNEAMWQHETKPRSYAMVEKYQELYKSEEFQALMGYSAKFFVDLTQYAARPLKRVDSKAKEEGFPPVVDVEKTRAIGFGAALNAAGICAPLFFGGSKYLQGDSKALTDMYLYDPKAQDTVNRMTYGVIMADMDVAWKYLGRDAPPEVELQKIAASHPAAGDRRAMAEQCLAKIHLEYNEVAGKLLKLHQSVLPRGTLTGGRVSDISDGKLAAQHLLTTLPPSLREQLEISLENIRQPRHELADMFGEMLKGTIDAKSINRESEQYKKTIYPAMGAIYECSEHTPRAYTRPKWVKATEQQQVRAA